MKKLLIIVIEGCSPEYISLENTPNIYRIARDGFCKGVKAAVPTIYNVNHTTILTGKFPCEHGLLGNTTYSGSGPLKSEPDQDLICMDTIMDFLRRRGASTALLTVRSEILERMGRNVDYGISLENSKDILVRYLDMPVPPPVESMQASLWILEACYRLIKKNTMDVIYCATNDFMMRKYGPETPEAIRQMKKIDDWLGKIYDLDHEREIYITGGFGVNSKPHLVNLQRVLNDHGYNVTCRSPQRDRLPDSEVILDTGLQFLFLNRLQESGSEAQAEMEQKLVKFLEEAPFISMVSPREEAAKRFNLPAEKIGDYVVFSADDYTFAEFDGKELELEPFRSSGSLSERAIPLIAVNSEEAPEKYRYSRDIVKIIMERHGGN